MSIRSLIRAVAVIVACGSLLTMSTQTARADPPEGVVRTFGILTSLTPDSEMLPYFFDEDSLACLLYTSDAADE